MAAFLTPILWLSLLAGAPAVAAPDSIAAPDTTTTPHRVVRSFPPVEVRALLTDMRSTQIVHPISAEDLRSLPIDDLAGAVALQPGVVAQAEQLHVRGGRAGETATSLDGVSLDEPLRGRAMDVPLFALRSAELVSGAPEARLGGRLAGLLDLRTVDPEPRASGAWRWMTDGRRGTDYDRIAARAGAPLGATGLGAVTAAEVLLDDTNLPAIRTQTRHDVAGLSLGWRAENRLLGFAKLAPVRSPERFSLQVLASREVHEPYAPEWSLDGWTYVPPNPKDSPIWSPVPLPGYQRYDAADHLPITDERRFALLARTGGALGAAHANLTFGWTRTRTVTSIGGGREAGGVVHRPRYPNGLDGDRFYVPWGDYPLYRESGSDMWTLRGDAAMARRDGSTLGAGAGATYEAVSMHEVDWMVLAPRAAAAGDGGPLDSLRDYRAWAPGAFAYAQGRWITGGMVLNAGLRAEWFTPGPQASQQTLPGSSAGHWSIGPRLGLAFPISVRDAFSFSYVRLSQAPVRDVLYDHRLAIGDRQPLGNPALAPATVVSYEAAVKHLFGPAWAMQTSVFYRDVYGQVGARNQAIPAGPVDRVYLDSDEGHTVGIEWSVIHDAARTRLLFGYTWMDAWGDESLAEGDPYGPIRWAQTPPIADRPLSWDRRHTVVAAGLWRVGSAWSLSWSTRVGSPLPWTPKPLREIPTDVAAVNSARLDWSETTDLDARWSPRRARSLTFGLEVRNLFDSHWETAATVDGYPNPVINTLYDDYGAYRTETGQGGGAYWSNVPGQTPHWVPVDDPRLYDAPRTVRVSVGSSW